MVERRKPGALRIAILGAFPPQAQGIPGYCGALATALARYGSVEAIGFKAMYPRWLFPGVRERIDPTGSVPEVTNLAVHHRLTWYNPLGWCWHALRLRADVLHIQWWSLPLAPVCVTFAVMARLRRVPVVITAHNVLPHEADRGFLWASRLLYRLADHVIVHSQANRQQLLSEFSLDTSRVSQIPMGIQAGSRPTIPMVDARRALGLPVASPTLLFFGIIRPYKGVEVLLRALARVRTAHPEVQLVIAGKPWGSWDACQALIEEHNLGGCIHQRLEYIPEAQVDNYFAAADLVVLPYTHFDAQSAVGVQVLGYGKPLLVTKVGGLPDLVNGNAQWCVEAQDSQALSGAIKTFFDDPGKAREQFSALLQERRKALAVSESAAAQVAIYHALGD